MDPLSIGAAEFDTSDMAKSFEQDVNKKAQTAQDKRWMLSEIDKKKLKEGKYMDVDIPKIKESLLELNNEKAQWLQGVASGKISIGSPEYINRWESYNNKVDAHNLITQKSISDRIVGEERVKEYETKKYQGENVYAPENEKILSAWMTTPWDKRGEAPMLKEAEFSLNKAFDKEAKNYSETTIRVLEPDGTATLRSGLSDEVAAARDFLKNEKYKAGVQKRADDMSTEEQKAVIDNVKKRTRRKDINIYEAIASEGLYIRKKQKDEKYAAAKSDSAREMNIFLGGAGGKNAQIQQVTDEESVKAYSRKAGSETTLYRYIITPSANSKVTIPLDTKGVKRMDWADVKESFPAASRFYVNGIVTTKNKRYIVATALEEESRDRTSTTAAKFKDVKTGMGSETTGTAYYKKKQEYLIPLGNEGSENYERVNNFLSGTLTKFLRDHEKPTEGVKKQGEVPESNKAPRPK